MLSTGVRDRHSAERIRRLGLHDGWRGRRSRRRRNGRRNGRTMHRAPDDCECRDGRRCDDSCRRRRRRRRTRRREVFRRERVPETLVVDWRSRPELHDMYGRRELRFCSIGERHEADREHGRAERRKCRYPPRPPSPSGLLAGQDCAPTPRPGSSTYCLAYIGAVRGQLEGKFRAYRRGHARS